MYRNDGEGAAVENTTGIRAGIPVRTPVNPGGRNLRRAALSGAALYAVAGISVLLNVVLVHDLEPVTRRICAGLAGLNVACSLVLAILPWERLRWLWLLPFAVVAFLINGAFILTLNRVEPSYAFFYLLVYIWVGLSFPRWIPTLLLPIAMGSLVIPLLRVDMRPDEVASIVFMVPLGLLLAELLAYNIDRLRSSQEESAHRAILLTAVTRAAREITSLDRATVLKEVTEAIQDMGFDAAAFITYQPGSTHYSVQHAHGAPDDFTRGDFPLGDGLVAEVVRSGSSATVTDSHEKGGVAEPFSRTGFQWLTVSPGVVADGRLLLLVAATRKGWHVTHLDVEAIEILAKLAGVALGNAEKYESQRDTVKDLGEIAHKDALTGLLNRHGGAPVLSGLRPGDGVLALDFDHFKRLNDTEGHQAGDELLRELGGFLGEQLRESDHAIRMGGEEFLLVLKNSARLTDSIANRLLEQWREREPRATFSVGIAICEKGESTNQTLKRADAALYQAKRSGRDRVCSANPEHAANATHQLNSN